MSRSASKLPGGARAADLVNIGVIARAVPIEMVESVLDETHRQSQRRRLLPADLMVYYVICLGLYMQVSCKEILRCVMDGLGFLSAVGAGIGIAGKAGITQARQRLGREPIKRLHDEIVAPVASEGTKGAWYRKWHLVSLDSSTMDVADTGGNDKAFGRPGTGQGVSAYPQIRFLSLVENGTHILFGSRMAPYRTGEAVLAVDVLQRLKPGMLCLADRYFFSYDLWKQAKETGADLLWRAKKNLILPCLKRFDDGSYLSKVYSSPGDRKTDTGGIEVRVIEYTLEGVPGAESLYRLLTTILDPDDAPAKELAALYHERWEIENAFDELKTHLKGSHIVLRSGTAEMVEQEFYGLMMAHYAVRSLMHEAALKGDVDPDELSYVHSVRVLRRKLPLFAAFPPSDVGRSLRATT